MARHGWTEERREFQFGFGRDAVLYCTRCLCGWRSCWYSDPDLAWRAAERRDAQHGDVLAHAATTEGSAS